MKLVYETIRNRENCNIQNHTIFLKKCAARPRAFSNLLKFKLNFE